MGTHSSPRRWTALSAGAAAVSVLALVVLAVWFARQPEASAGQALADVRACTSATSAATATASPTASASPSPTPTASAPRTLPTATARDASLDAQQDAASPPTRLVIPDLDVDATVYSVGVQDDGAMVIPAEPTRVGWYQYGPAPDDEQGNTVIAGHVATQKAGPGALSQLRKAEPGMRVTVTTKDGEEHEYEIAGRERIFKKALPVDEIFARDGDPLLVIITCGGEYNRELRSHRDNIVVTATPVS